MATVPSNPGLLDVVAVFGGNGELNAYYRGGPYVPNIPANQGVPDNPGALSLVQLAGATNYAPMSLSISPAQGSASGLALNAVRPPRQGVAQIDFTVSVGNGAPPYSYSWGSVNQGGFAPSVSPSGNVCNVRIASGSYMTSSGIVGCTVTDGTGAQAYVQASYNLVIDSDV